MWMMCWLAAACSVGAAFCFYACVLPSPNFTGIGGRYDNPLLGRCGNARRWAACCGQHKESEPVVGAQFSMVVHGRSLLMEFFFWLIPFARETCACQTVSSTIHL